MRDDIIPKWEDYHHLNGCYSIIDLKQHNYHEIFINCLLGIIGESFTEKYYPSHHITGVTYINDDNYKQIRIWVSDINMKLYIKNIEQEYLPLLFGDKIICDPLTPLFYTAFNKLKKPKQIKHLKDLNERSMPIRPIRRIRSPHSWR
jgi:hypothetical protein